MKPLKRILILVLLVPHAASAQLPDDVEVGAYVEVRGALRSAGGVVAEEVEVRAFGHEGDRVRGVLESVLADGRGLSVAGVSMRLEAGARLTDARGRPLARQALRSGQSVDVTGQYVDGVFSARSLAVVRAGPPDGAVKLEGRIDAVDAEADAIRLLGVGVRLTPQTRIALD